MITATAHADTIKCLLPQCIHASKNNKFFLDYHYGLHWYTLHPTNLTSWWEAVTLSIWLKESKLLQYIHAITWLDKVYDQCYCQWILSLYWQTLI